MRIEGNLFIATTKYSGEYLCRTDRINAFRHLPLNDHISLICGNEMNQADPLELMDKKELATLFPSFVEFEDSDGDWALIDPRHIASFCEHEGRVQISLGGKSFRTTAPFEEVRSKLGW